MKTGQTLNVVVSGVGKSIFWSEMMLNEMTNQQLIDTLKIASENEGNIALKMLLLMAAERIQDLVDDPGIDEDFRA